MCAVAVLNGAEYEFMHHAPVYIKVGGPAHRMDMLKLWGTPAYKPEVFEPLELQAIELTVAMTQQIEVPQTLMASLQNALGNTALVELVGVVATYNMVSRFLVALQVTPEQHND